MSLQWAARAGPLRHLRLSAVFSRPTRVIAVQNQLRRVCLAAKPRLATPQTGSLSALISQQSRSLATATETETPKAKRGRKPGSTTKAKTPKKKAVKAKKPKVKKRLTEKQKVAKAARERREQIKELKGIALVPPKKLTASAWPLAVREQVAELKSGSGTSIEKFSEAISRAKSLTSDEYNVRPIHNNIIEQLLTGLHRNSKPKQMRTGPPTRPTTKPGLTHTTRIRSRTPIVPVAS